MNKRISNKAIEKSSGDTRIGRVVQQFNVLWAVRCNRCKVVLYANSNDVDADMVTGTMERGFDTWKQSGRTEHRCRRGKRKEIEG